MADNQNNSSRIVFAAILAIFVYGVIAAMLGVLLASFNLTPEQNGNIALAQAIGGPRSLVVQAVIVIVAFTLQWVVLVRNAGSFGVISDVVYLVPLAVFAIAVVRSLVARVSRTPVQWRGRDVAVGVDRGTS